METPVSLPKLILQNTRELSEGGVVSPKEFLHLGSRAAVDQAFSRLTKSGELLRVARGIYTAPVTGRFGRRAPASTKVVEALGQLSGDTIVPHGATAANSLGLSQQIPIQEIFLTSGPTRSLRLGKSPVLIKKAPSWQLVFGKRPAGDAVRALDWLGRIHVEGSVRELRRQLPPQEWNHLRNRRAALPSWMAEAIGREAASG